MEYRGLKLATLKTENRDGRLIVASRDLTRGCEPPAHLSTLQAALDDWEQAAPQLETLYAELNASPGVGFKVAPWELAAPLPRAYQWLDGSSYLSHVERVRRARGAPLPPSFLHEPLMYQGGSDCFLGPRDPIQISDLSWGADFEAEIAVITGDVPVGVTASDAGRYIRLCMLINDISLRNLIPAEVAKGFGFIHGKPPTACSPVAVTPTELGEAWRMGKLHRPLVTHLNGKLFGQPNAGADMQFGFPQLISHAAKTRPLRAGSILGSGTVSNVDLSNGCSCLAEKRVLETIAQGAPKTPFLDDGDEMRIEMFDQHGVSLFGAIEQTLQVVS